MFVLYGFKFVYENWCWVIWVFIWKEVWEIVKMVDWFNIGLCLDIFQIVGGEWGDLIIVLCFIEGVLVVDFIVWYKDSFEELLCMVLLDKIYFLQISDVYKMDELLVDVVE